jgi:DNA-binding transcriptional regulator GbsR (MarR family)
MKNTDAIRDAELLTADAIGDVIEHWGFRKALGRVWTVLYLLGEPQSAAALCERLAMSTGAMSMTLNELQEWGVVHRVWRPGERREFFEAETDFWKMISKVVSERERFLAASVRERLARAAEVLGRDKDTREEQDRVKRLLGLANVAQTVIDSFIAARLADFSPFSNLLQFTRAAEAKKKR